MQAKRFSISWSVKLTLLLAIPLSLAAYWLPAVEGHAQSATPEQAEFFEKKIRPLLAAKCQKCHSADAQVAGDVPASPFARQSDAAQVGAPGEDVGDPAAPTPLKRCHHRTPKSAVRS